MTESQEPAKKPKKKKEPFRVWPLPTKPDQPYGPTDKQKLLFIDKLSHDIRPHLHPVDIVLYVGGSRSGKTTGAVARTISYLLENPGAVAIVGAENYPLLQRSALKEWTDRFSRRTPWDMLQDKNPIIIKKPTQGDKRVIFRNGSQAIFLHFNDPDILRGIDASIIHFEEACLLPDEASCDELVRRLSGRKGKVRQLILTTNPTGGKGWIDDKFKLEQTKTSFTGTPEPLCLPCTCHLCSECRNVSKREVEYVNGFCPDCNTRKENECPGGQVYMRVIQTASHDNKHIPQDYIDTQRGFMDKKSFSIFVEGQNENLLIGEVYKAFSDDNVYRTPEPISFEKDIVWTLDFNFEPQSSVICQEEETSNGFVIKVLEEIILWNALPAHAAEYFCNLPEIKQWNEKSNRSVLIYGDPAGLFTTGKGLVQSTYQILYDVLRKNGFDARLMMRRPDPDAVIKEQIQVPIAGRIDAVNAMLRSSDDQMRLKINPQCKNVIKSLRELQWAEDGKNLDHTCDRRARRKADHSAPALMTHPTDALGYYIYKRFPIVKHKQGIQFIQIPGQNVIQVEDGKITEYPRMSGIRQITKEEQEARDKELAEREQKRIDEIIRRTSSIAGTLRYQGIWPGTETSYGNSFQRTFFDT